MMQPKMALQFSTEKIKSQLAEPYTKNDKENSTLDGECDPKRMLATSATRILHQYFEKHPEDSIENYMK